MSERWRLSDAEITDLLRRRSARPARDDLAATVLDSLASERVHHPRRITGRSSRRSIVLLATAAVLLVGGALVVGSSVLPAPSIVPSVPAPSFAALTNATPHPTTTSTPSSSASPSPTPSLDLTWTEVPLDGRSPRLAWIGDRFVLADVESGAVRTSTDGQTWQAIQPGDAAGYVDLLKGSLASWQHTAVGWWNPQDGPDYAGKPPITARDIVTTAQIPGAPSSSTPFKGRIESIGIGPRGIVAEVHSDLDWDDWVRRKLGARTNNEWVTHLKSVDFLHGVLNIKLDNGPGLRVVWADEGFEPGDYQDRGFGWYSPDGKAWTEMSPKESEQSALQTGAFGSVVGVSDGFIATGAYPDGACADPNGSCTGMWQSSDGLAWRFLGTAPQIGSLLPWSGGALATYDDGQIDVWTSGGSEELPIGAHPGTVGAGPLGLVSVGDGEVLVSRDGIDSKVSAIPAQMADATGRRGRPSVVVGDQSVLVLEWKRIDEFTMQPSLWLGTFAS